MGKHETKEFVMYHDTFSNVTENLHLQSGIEGNQT